MTRDETRDELSMTNRAHHITTQQGAAHHEGRKLGAPRHSVLGAVASAVTRAPLILALATSAWSCAGVQEVVDSKRTGGGVSAVYSVPSDKAQEIGVAVFRWGGAELVEEHPKDGYLLAGVGMSTFSWGTVMGAWFDSVEAGKTRVTVVTKRRYALAWSSDLTEEEFHDHFAQAVAIVSAGGELPKSAPD